MHKTMSQKQLEANRRNGRRSKGPKTKVGKARSKLNALKHGILSADVVVRSHGFCELHSEFDTLRRQFWRQYAPVGPVEEMLVDRIVSTNWRIRRAARAEVGEIAVSVDGGHWQRNRTSARFHRQFLTVGILGDAAVSMEESMSGLGWLFGRLQNVRAAVEKDGELTDAALKETHYDDKPNSLTRELAALRTVAIENANGLDEAALKTRRRDKILTAIDEMVKAYESKLSGVFSREQDEEFARQTAALPCADTLDKILRYETTLDRQMYRAMNQLERLQRARQGEIMPPPLNLEVSAK